MLQTKGNSTQVPKNINQNSTFSGQNYVQVQAHKLVSRIKSLLIMLEFTLTCMSLPKGEH